MQLISNRFSMAVGKICIIINYPLNTLDYRISYINTEVYTMKWSSGIMATNVDLEFACSWACSLRLKFPSSFVSEFFIGSHRRAYRVIYVVCDWFSEGVSWVIETINNILAYTINIVPFLFWLTVAFANVQFTLLIQASLCQNQDI